jgi:hypothetical protein
VIDVRELLDRCPLTSRLERAAMLATVRMIHDRVVELIDDPELGPAALGTLRRDLAQAVAKLELLQR